MSNDSRRVEPSQESSPTGILSFLALCVRHAGLATSVLMLAVLGGLLVGWLRQGYVATSSFVPSQTGEGVTGLSGLAAQFGVSLPNQTAEGGAQFYAALVKSTDLLAEVATTRFELPISYDLRDSVSGSFITLNHIQGETPAQQLRKAVEDLQRDVTTTVDIRAGIVTVQTRARWAALAEDLNKLILDKLQEFNMQKQQSQAHAERVFLEGRAEQAADELRSAENDLRSFLERNRRYQDSPQLAFEAARLQRAIDLRQGVYSSLEQAYERARIDEVRNTPVITVVAHPEGSAEPNHSVLMGGALGMFAGIVGAFGAVLLREYLRKEFEYSPEEVRALASILRRWRSRLRLR